MKRTAFLQAILILLLLGISWVVLFLRLNPGERATDLHQPPQVAGESVPQQTSKPEAIPVLQNPDRPMGPVPERWQEWWDYLDAMENPGEMRQALDDLRQLIMSMTREEAITWILEFVESGTDFSTGLAFQLKSEGSLLAANSLRAFLLDLLHQLDSTLAADIAWQELQDQGTRLVPDVYVIHMRNYAKSPAMEEREAFPFLGEHLEAMLNYPRWIENPTSAIAEAMDIAVYMEDVRFVPRLTTLMEREHPQMLRHASALSVERLVVRQPLETLGILLDNMAGQNDIANARAGYFARLDPNSLEATKLLDDYLKSPALGLDEAVRFLESFPNLNRSLSYNLLSTNISNTPPGGYVDRLENCLEQVRSWQTDRDLARLNETLVQTEARILSQLTGQPLP